MQVSAVHNNISFGRALTPKEMKEYKEVRDKAKTLTGQTGKSIFIVHDACLPQSDGKNTGLGHVSSKDSQEFFSYMKDYIGFNTVEFLPQGQVPKYDKFYCAYSSDALSLGNHEINPELLTTEEFGNILTKDEYKEIVKSNVSPNKETIANYKNVMDDFSPQDNALRKAYGRFKNLDPQSKLRKDYETFVSKNNDWLEPKGIYKVLSRKNGGKQFAEWANETDRRLYDDTFDEGMRKKRINQVLTDSKDEIGFYKFKQFLADSHLAIGRKKLNDMGLKLTGDCEINFSKDEVWANPKAFKKDHKVGVSDWGAPCLEYDNIKDPNSPSAKLLKRKVQLCAQRYDGIRFDVGWAYVMPRVFEPGGKTDVQPLGDDVLSFIENSVKEVKGKDYDLNNLMYEFEGGDVFKPNSGELIDPVKNRVKIYGSTYMHENSYDMWGSNDAFIRRGWNPDKFVIGIGNHDPQPLRQIANNVPDDAMGNVVQYHKHDAIYPLSKILKIDAQKLENPVEFAKAKWAEPMMAKNNMMFYMDVFGREERFDMQDKNLEVTPEKNFAYKIPKNYKEEYHKAIQEGYGFNVMDSLEKVFKAKALDKSHPKLYEKIVKYRDILNQEGFEPPKLKTSNRFLKPAIIAISTLGAIGVCTAYYLKSRKNGINPKPQTKSATTPISATVSASSSATTPATLTTSKPLESAASVTATTTTPSTTATKPAPAKDANNLH